MSTFFSAAGFCPKLYKRFCLRAKASPSRLSVPFQWTTSAHQLGGALRDFKFYYKTYLILLFFAVYGIWDDLGTWKRLLRDMPMICLQFGEFSKMLQNREVSTFFPAAGFCPKQYDKFYLPAKAPPSCSIREFM